MSKALNNKIKLNDIVSVKDFGAKGDGVTDDTAAIQAADAAATGSVFFPAGVYKVTSEITKKLGVSWQGNGFASGAQSPQQPATKIVVDGPTSGNFITVQGATPGVGEANLFFDGIAFSATGASTDLLVGIYTFIKMTRIQNCSFTNFATGVKHGAVETWIVGNYFSSCAICIDSSGGESHITDNHGFPESVGILLRGSGTLVQGNKFFGDGASGDIGLEVWSKQNTIVNNVFDAFTDVGILLKSNTIGAAVDANVIVGNTISGIGNGGTYDSAIVMQALNANITNNTITGNSISNNRGDRVMVYGIKADVSAGRVLQNNAIVANTITSCTSAPLNFSGSGTRQFNVYRDNVGQAGTANKTFGTVAGYNGLTVTHNLGYTPDHVYVMPESNQVGAIGVDLITSTDFRLLMRDLSNVAIPSGSPVTTRWVAELIDLP